MNIRKVKEIVKFEVEKSVQNKWFVILNILFFIIILIATNISNIKKFMEENNIQLFKSEEYTIQILDKENIFYDEFLEKNKDTKYIKFEKVENNEYSKENIPEENIVLVEIQKDEEKVIGAKIISKENFDDDVYDLIYENLNECRSQVFAKNNGIERESLNILNEELSIEEIKLGIDDENAKIKQMIQNISIFIIYAMVLFVLSKIANQIISEKVSKSTEYVLTSVTAKEYLLAKIISSTVNVAILLIYGIVYFLIGSSISTLINGMGTGSENVIGIMNIDSGIIGYVIAIIGYLIFTIFLITLIQATIASKATNVNESGNTTAILSIVIIIAFYISGFAITPYSIVPVWVYILSVIPIFSMFFIPSMMIIGQATTIQIIVSFIVLILSSVLGLNICSKKFKNGILDYTNKKNLKMKKELNIKERQEKELKVKMAKRFSFTIGLGMMISIVLVQIIGIISMIMVPTIYGHASESIILIMENSIVLIIALGLSAMFIMGYSKDYEEKKNKINVTLKSKFEMIFGGITVIAIIQVIWGIIEEKIGLNYDIFGNAGIGEGGSLLENILCIIGIALVPAIFEELLFRKAILNASKRFGKCFSVVFSALLFGLYHMNLAQGIIAFLIGLILGIIAFNTNSIKYTGILHFINNLYACLLMIFNEGSIGYIITNILIVICIVIGAIVILKNLSRLKKINKNEIKLNDDCKYLFKDYTFIMSMILIIVMLIATESSLHIL